MRFRLATRALVSTLAAALLAASAADAQYAVTPIVVPGALATHAEDSNNLGQIVGDYVLDIPREVGPTIGFIYDNGALTQLRVPVPGGPAFYTSASGINDVGQVVGTYAYAPSYATHGFLYSGGAFTTVDVPGATRTSLVGINNIGQIVGSYDDAAGLTRAFLYDAGVFTTLAFTWAHDINELGQIVGILRVRGEVGHGVLADVDHVTLLDAPGAVDTFTAAIDNAGRVVGSAAIPGQGDIGFVYSGGIFRRIDVPGLGGVGVRGTNDAGQVVWSRFDAVTSRTLSFVATPTTATPEPATWALLGAGLLAIGGVARRRAERGSNPTPASDGTRAARRRLIAYPHPETAHVEATR